MPLLKKGVKFRSNVTGNCYQVMSHLVARGGFGEVYQGAELDDHRDVVDKVAIKVALNPLAWHGEAYFGRLLEGQKHVVPLRDAFPLVEGTGSMRRVKYVLVFDWMAEGTVEDAFGNAAAWTERRVVKQIDGLLSVLALLHKRGICHADITPGNVFVDRGRLLLGDLGIAKQGLEDGPVKMDGAAPPIFQPRDARFSQWAPADDVYQVGLIALSLLSGAVVTSDKVRGQLLRTLTASDGMKGWIRDALQPRSARFKDAVEARQCLREPSIAPARVPKSLQGQSVVFTGTLPIPRSQAKAQVRRAGATVQEHVNSKTTLIVAGESNPQMIGQQKGRKLYDAHRRIQRGQKIAIVGIKQFERLLARAEA